MAITFFIFKFKTLKYKSIPMYLLQFTGKLKHEIVCKTS